MGHKRFSRIDVKSADQGKVSAVFATLNVVDKDGDVTLPGAFEDGAEVLISAYGHTSWGGTKPVGKGIVRTTDTEAIMDGQFFLDTADGRETFSVIKQLGSLQEYSYGYDILDAGPGKWDGEDVQFLRRLKVYEVSPVMIGAGVNTRTLAAKAAQQRSLVAGGMMPEEAVRVVTEYKAAIRPHETPATKKPWDFAEGPLVPDGATVDDLRAIHAYADPRGDPTSVKSYDYAHHHGVGGAANLRAAFAGIGRLVKGDHGLTGEEVAAVYGHLAAHLEDGDIEPPEMRSEGGIIKQNAELAVILADWQAARARLWETKRSRALKGKALGATTVMILEWIGDDQRATKSLLDSPQEDADREFARYVQALLAKTTIGNED